jgi:hypothetical protein
MRLIRSPHVFTTSSLALLAGLLVAVALAAGLPQPTRAGFSFDAREHWDGRWKTDAGRVRFNQDQEELTGTWKCGCADDRRAVVDGIAYPPDQGEGRKARGDWSCPDGSDSGRFRIKLRDGTNDFSGWYTAESTGGERVDWTGERKINSPD